MTSLDIRVLTAADLPGHLGDMLDVYRDAYADRIDNSFFTEERYWERVEMGSLVTPLASIAVGSR